MRWLLPQMKRGWSGCLVLGTFLIGLSAPGVQAQQFGANPLRSTDDDRVVARPAAAEPAKRPSTATAGSKQQTRPAPSTRPRPSTTRAVSRKSPRATEGRPRHQVRPAQFEIDLGQPRSVLSDEGGATDGAVLRDAPEPIEIEMDETVRMFDESHVVGGDCCDASCEVRCPLSPCQALCMGAWEGWGGVHGFTGPTNRGDSGSFGFHYGFNWGGPVPCLTRGDLSAQFGVQAAHSNFSGADFTTNDRSQLFVTGGFFKRVDCGLQGGIVFDYLHDNWYHNVNVTQFRGEFSWVFPTRDELGFWFNASTSDPRSSAVLINQPGSPEETWQATDIYAFFYRRRLDNCGKDFRAFVGISGESDALIGADFNLPLGNRFAIESGFAYLIPEEGTGGGGEMGESWNVGVNLVWYPHCRSDPRRIRHRPLFRVADNGSMFVDRF